MPLKVSLHAPTELMDGWLISAAVQKAATTRKHDIVLWHSFAKRALELAPYLTSQQLGYLYYGFGKSLFLNEDFYRTLVQYTEPLLPELGSSSLMCVVWTLNRLQLRHSQFLTKLASVVAEKIDDLRVTDLVKICNGLARLDVCPPMLKQCISERMTDRLEALYAQDFRNAVNALAMFHLYDERTQIYIMERFSKIFICARPQHLRQALSCAVVMRVVTQHVWLKLHKSTRNFYTRLSTRKIHHPEHKPSDFHWDVSNILAKLGVSHRNSFYWGCYWIDIGEVEERKNCWFVDGPCCFYTGTTQYTNKVKLQHRILESLGWEIRRVPWFKWVDVLNSTNDKMLYIKHLSQCKATGDTTLKTEPLDSTEIRQKLRIIKNHYAAAATTT
ncbi:uncharacterized protein BXIN_1543 [Babesia sp. Xinjiang]|uniref:uncharacterized protein n=1 Tax=Babesia sp. Xinjiang TaxID=462227 RepID=UPI000A25901F|nr:uncharacterized protein BXIN_1543 [Babesia sp. Xinjiang]ORM42307.1 hypothetical protein BXIN_1543 [Babesia sp. Xinjiang]